MLCGGGIGLCRFSAQPCDIGYERYRCQDVRCRPYIPSGCTIGVFYGLQFKANREQEAVRHFILLLLPSQPISPQGYCGCMIYCSPFIDTSISLSTSYIPMSFIVQKWYGRTLVYHIFTLQNKKMTYYW
jgi:hypothetical protein